MNAVAVKNEVNEAVVIDYLKSMGLNVDDDNAKKFINIAKSFGLNPFKREIYAIPYGKSWNVIVGYEVYIKRAERTGKLGGWRVWTEGTPKNEDLKACIEIKRRDWDEPFYHEVYYDEYNQNNNMWKTKARTMIKKVAIAQGFRLAFPDELGGIPYTDDEIETIEVQEVKETPKQKEDKPLQLMSKILEAEGLTTKETKAMFAEHMQQNGLNIRDEKVIEDFLKEPLKLKQYVRHFLDEINGEIDE